MGGEGGAEFVIDGVKCTAPTPADAKEWVEMIKEVSNDDDDDDDYNYDDDDDHDENEDDEDDKNDDDDKN